jgi:hypothetical protein
MKKLIAALLLLTTTLLLFTACFGTPDNGGNAGGAPDPAPLKIGYMSDLPEWVWQSLSMTTEE